MKILMTGMSSHHTKPSKNVTFFRLLSQELSDIATIEWAVPSVSWSKEYLDQYDYVVVGFTPITSPSANKVYGALNVINLMYSSEKLIMVLDHPQLWQYKHGLNAVNSNPMSLFGNFYSKRREFSLAKSDENLKNISEAVNKLLTVKWPKTIYPSLPWPTNREFYKYLGFAAEESLIPLNLDSFMLSITVHIDPASRSDHWICDQPTSDWVKDISKLIEKPIKPVSEKLRVTDAETFQSVTEAMALLLPPQPRGVGVWWSSRIIQALQSGTPIVSDWKETSVLGPEWSILAYDLESQSPEDRSLIAKHQKISYTSSIPTREYSKNILSSLFK